MPLRGEVAVQLKTGSAVSCEERINGAGYGDRTRLTGLGSQGITTMLSPHREASLYNGALDERQYALDEFAIYQDVLLAPIGFHDATKPRSSVFENHQLRAFVTSR